MLIVLENFVPFHINMQNMYKIEFRKRYRAIVFVRFSLNFVKNCRINLFFIKIFIKKGKIYPKYKYTESA